MTQKRFALLPVLALSGFLGACAQPQQGGEFNDPYEEQNRAAHAANVQLDRWIFRGGKPHKRPILPLPLAHGLSNFAGNLGMPSAVLNSVLQGRPKPALRNTARFLVNTTIGIGGLFDPATGMGLHAEETDFGETLHVWGAGQGAYYELPVLGPTTDRDFAGTVVDAVINPLGAVANSAQRQVLGYGAVGGWVGNRVIYSDLIESTLYGSADSYAQTRLLYLQNRNFQLGIEDETFDPYADPFAQ